MDRAGAERAQCGPMLLHRIPLVLRKTVARIFAVISHHARVTRGLGDNGSRRDGQALAVAADDRVLRQRHLAQPSRIEQQM
jgi:hypothetical protein